VNLTVLWCIQLRACEHSFGVEKEKQQQCSEYQAPPYKIQLPRICAPCTSSQQFRTNSYCIYSNARWGFPLKFGT